MNNKFINKEFINRKFMGNKFIKEYSLKNNPQKIRSSGNKFIIERSVKLILPSNRVVKKSDEVFYNPVMSLNRDISVLILKLFGRNWRVCDPLAGSGIRAIRIAKEVSKHCVKDIVVNDGSTNAVFWLKKNVRANNVKFSIFNMDASRFLLSQKGFDYLDIDPFGSPAPFLDVAVRSVGRGGILAVTATDSAALAGTAVDACRRKYWSEPLHGEIMHEIALRILCRKVMLVGAQYDYAFTPILSYWGGHYYRIFFIRSRNFVEKLLSEMQFFFLCSCGERGVSKNNFVVCPSCKKQVSCAGPLWAGQLHSSTILSKLLSIACKDKYNSAVHLLSLLKEESDIPVVGFFDIHASAKRLHCEIPQISVILSNIRKKGFKVARTHLCQVGIRTDAKWKDIITAVKTAVKKN